MGVTGVAIVLISAAGESSVITTMVSMAGELPSRVTSTSESVCLQEALPPVSVEHDRIFAGSAGSVSVAPAGLRMCR